MLYCTWYTMKYVLQSCASGMRFAARWGSHQPSISNSLAACWFLSRSSRSRLKQVRVASLNTFIGRTYNRFFNRSSRLIKGSIFTVNIGRICCRREQTIEPRCFWGSVGIPCLVAKRIASKVIERAFPVNPTANLSVASSSFRSPNI